MFNKLLKSHYIVQVGGGGQLKLTNSVISDKRIPRLAGIPLFKSREFSRREYSMCQLCSIRHDILVTLHTPGAYGQCSVFEVGWLQPLQLWLNAGILWRSQCWFHEIKIYIPLGLNQLVIVGVDQWLKICIMDTCQWAYVLTKGLFCKLVHFFISVNATVA